MINKIHQIIQVCEQRNSSVVSEAQEIFVYDTDCVLVHTQVFFLAYNLFTCTLTHTDCKCLIMSHLNAEYFPLYIKACPDLSVCIYQKVYVYLFHINISEYSF